MTIYRKLFLGLILIGILFCALNQIAHCEIQSASFQGWQVEDRGGHCSESNGVLRLWSNGGSDCPSISFYKQIDPTDDFTFSVQVNAETAESCGVFVRNSLPIGGNMDGFNFEFGHYDEGLFLLARNTSNARDGQFESGMSSYWTVDQVAYGNPHVWYTMQLSVSSSPFKIQMSVFIENGTLIGSFSTSNIDNFTFADINYIGLIVWGYSPSDYSFRNIQSPFNNPASISISTESSSANAGSVVNVFGTLTDSNNNPIQNETVVLSYTFTGAHSWIPLSSDQTNENGNYTIQWINSASGTFTLKTEWSRNSSYTGASNATELSFLPYRNQKVFFVESNNTVHALAFNNETSTFSFSATGPSETTGYVKATISKTLLANVENLQVQLDGKQFNYSVTSTVDSWVVTFNYSHSTHQISIHLETNGSSTLPVGNASILIAIIVLFGTILTVETKYWFGRKEKVPKK